ncbi:MAG: hypothetical protein ACYC99_08800 [Candidatus Geothermincolia bacterium]
MGSNAKFELPETGLWGFSHCAFFDSWYPWSGLPFAERVGRIIQDLTLAGADSFRPHIHWHKVEPFLGAGLLGPEDVTDELVASYAEGGSGIDWAPYDLMIDSLAAAGIEPHIVLGAGNDFQLPVSTAGSTCARAVPDCIGKDRYLSHVYLHARGVVRRYRDRVRIWQLENELNVAGETMLLARWRTGRAWLDRGFRDALIEILCSAVREEDPRALTSHNFHTDMRVLKGVYDWRMDVRRWLKHVDVVGVDSYPNYLFGWPERGAAVGRRVREAREAAGGKPVMVLESGYPVKPGYRGMSESRQASYVCSAVDSAACAGAQGFYYYCLCSPEGFPVEGPWSNKFFQNIEPWWGMVRRDDSKRAAWFEYRRAMEDARMRLLKKSA